MADDDSSHQTPQARLFTPLGDDVLLLKSFAGTEKLSGLFKFTLELYCTNKKRDQVQFEKLLGKEFSIECDVYSREKEVKTEENRYFSGICFEFSEGLRDYDFTFYTAEIVPKVQLLTLQADIRMFQQKTVPDILKEVLPKSGVEYQLTANYDKREYCVQYRETNWDFVCRLMEEEGIFFFFKYEKLKHTMVIADSALKHPKVQEPDTVGHDPTEGGNRRAAFVGTWAKAQRLKTTKHTYRDFHFQLPNSTLESTKTTQDSSDVGKVDHKLQVVSNDQLEVYDYPGGYSRRVDGVNKSGGDQSSELQTIHPNSQRTAKLRNEEETMPTFLISASSNCIHFAGGHKFTVEETAASKDFKGDGDYILTEVQHKVDMAVGYRSGEAEKFAYSNKFVCTPYQINYRPPRTTKKPIVMGVQTAMVVGPPGEEIFTDKYGRVKVQFHWDRKGKNDADSSCWLRVATAWAGKQWGMIHIPRIGQEVIVDFIEGDPDAPIIIGSVYNPNTMPPYTLPDNKTQSGIKTRSSKEGTPDNFNEIRFEDKKGSEELYIHAEKDENIVVEHDKTEKIGHDQTVTVGNNDTLTVTNEQSITIGVSQDEKIGAERTTQVGATDSLTVGAERSVTTGASDSLTAGADISLTSGAAISLTAGAAISISASGAISITGSAIAITAPALTLNGRPVAPLPAPPI
ncbi:MAG: type VI secretion system tip protein TssI/VgrG [Chthoniobacter sp.]